MLITNDNKGHSFIIAAANAYYGVSGGDNCYTIDVSGQNKLIFSATPITSAASVSTNIQFLVPGKGILTNGTGGNTYEILAISPIQLSLRNIGADGNSWYQILKAK